MRRAIYPGSFDPVTNGHLDIIERGSKLFDEIIIAILVNPEKRALFSIEERREMLEASAAEIRSDGCRLRVDSFQGLLVKYAVEQQADAIVRGIRAVSDYEYELQMALMNRRLEPRVETVFLTAGAAYSYISSRLVKEIYQLGGDIDGLVPASVAERMRAKLGEVKPSEGGTSDAERGDKSKYTDKQKRQAEHIEESYEERGLSEEEAERRAWATVNKTSGGGKKPGGSGYGKGGKKSSSRKSSTKKSSSKKSGSKK